MDVHWRNTFSRAARAVFFTACVANGAPCESGTCNDAYDSLSLLQRDLQLFSLNGGPGDDLDNAEHVLGEGVAIRKRGYGGFLGDYFTCDDARALNLHDSWHYTWTPKPSQGKGFGGTCSGRNISAEFVPMMINWMSASQIMSSAPSWAELKIAWQETNVRYLLGYNEPDPGNHPHMMTPLTGAQNWPALQNMAAQFTPPLTLVAPSISYDNVTVNGQSLWLDEFFFHCENTVPECDPALIKYVAFHDYGLSVTMMVQRIKGMAKRYNRKVWLTEFAVGKFSMSGGPSRSHQNWFLRKALPLLDELPELYRYAWFAGRDAPTKLVGESSLLPYDTNDTTPTSTGHIYAQPEGTLFDDVHE